MSISDEKQDLLFNNASMLVGAAKVNATTILAPLLQGFPILKQIEKEKKKGWNFIVAIAGVFIGVLRLINLQLEEEYTDELLEIINSDLNSNSILCLDNCREFFQSGCAELIEADYEPSYIESDVLGKWVFINLLERNPKNQDEANLVHTLGVMISHAFSDWWNIQK